MPKLPKFSSSNTSAARPPVILQVLEACGSGPLVNTGRMATATHAAANIQHVFLYGQRAQTPEVAEIAAKFPEGTPLVRWCARRNIFSPLNVLAVWQLWRTIWQYKPTAIHAHCSFAGALCRMACPFGRIPVFYSPRAYAFLSAKGAKAKLYWLLEKFLGVFPHTTIPCGAGEAELAKQVVPAKRIRPIYNSQNTELLGEMVAGAKPFEAFTVVCAGRINAQKDFPFFLEVAKCCPAINFVWAGGVGYGKKLPEGMVEADLPRNILVTGWRSQAETVRSIYQGHAYIMTSHYEGLATNVLEAMAFAKPLVLRNTVGNKEMVEHGTDGFVAETPEEMAELLTQLNRDTALAQRLGQAGQKKLHAEYSDAVTLPKWVKLYTGK